MKRILPSFGLVLILLLSVLIVQKAQAQALLTENFDYASGTLLTTAGWSAHSGSGTQPVDVVVPGLTFAGYPLSNTGGAAQLDASGEDVNKTFASQTSGSVYVSFMVKVDAMVGGYFFHLGQASMGTTYFARVWLAAGTGSNFKFGLGKGSESTPATSSTEFTTGTTYLAVLKYNILDGATNDEVSLYIISGAVPSAEPATATIPAFTTTAADYSPGSVGMRQFDNAQRIVVDGIRVGKTWAEAVTSSTADLAAPVFNAGFPKVANVNATQADLQVNMDEAGKAFYLVVPDGSATPTAAEVFAGTNYGTVTKIASGSINVDAGGSVKSVALTGLTDKTNYDIYVIAQDDEASPNKQAAPVLVSLYTIRPPDIISSADFNTSLAPFTQVSITGDALWDMYTINTENKCAKMSGFVNNVNNENRDYLISPVIDLDASDLNKLSFSTAKNYTGPALKVLISANFNGTFNAAAVTAATWTDITSNFAYSTGSFTFVPSGEFSLSAFTGKAYIAFVYESTTSQSATWEVDDFLVTGYKKSSGIENLNTGEISLFPVPARNEIRFNNLKGVSTIEVFDIHGKLVMTEIMDNQVSGQMNVSRLTQGLYVVRFNRSNAPVVMKFVKE